MDFYGFYTGKVFDAYKYLGAHVTQSGVTFRTFAPGAAAISLIGECTYWQEHPMKRVYNGHFWECHIDCAYAGTMYKYRIYHHDGTYVDHCDPYSFGMEKRPGACSVIRQLNQYSFHDEDWMHHRSDCKYKPLNIYEVHLGSFRKPGENPDDWFNYEELAELLIPYLKRTGYNYLEIMPVNEHPCDQSWGYQSTGFFSPTSRYGTADQLKAFVDTCHQNGIGVIMDFVPVHFAVDDYGLARYDGTALYEYPHPAVGESEWGTFNFMHSRGEVRSFLQSAANYWLTEFHFDGLRMDAISRAIYWQGDPHRGVNQSAVEFLQYMNQGLKQLHPAAILVAEDSTAYPGVTKPVSEGGLGFDYKWDMGWMNDTLDYFHTAPEYRSGIYHKLTFSMMYFYNDRFLLPLSHDEVVHGKATILGKMWGNQDQKLAQLRAFYMYMYAHPGKKLNFMGNELAQLREWDERRQQDWHLLEDPDHQSFYKFMSELNKIYLSHPALSAMDHDRPGFQWIDCNLEEECVYAFRRMGRGEKIAAVFNFSNREQNFRLNQNVQCLFSSDGREYSGGDVRLAPFTAVYYLES